jgi:predicted RNase H-like HicB family nuclease
MAHYLAVLVPRSGAGWRARFPDFPGCRVEGPTVEAAIDASGAAATA